MLKVINLSKKYGNLEVLKGISFQIKERNIYGFLGQNGAGKSTTMNILSGLINYSSGEIYLDGKDFKSHKRELLKNVGYLPQNPVFYGYMTGYEYLNFIGKLSNMPQKLIRERSEELLDIVDLKEAAKRRIGGYSGGMKQRFGLAVSMFNRPKLLFLDEPTSALDPEGRMEVLDLISRLKEQGITIFLSTHILNDVERVCDEVSILNQGEIILSKGLEELKNDYIQPIFDVEFERNCSNLREKLPAKWVEKITIDNNKASIYVKNIDLAKEELLKHLVLLNNPIMFYSLRKSNLEDIFIRLVNNNDNL